jgi:hypothetical protein
MSLGSDTSTHQHTPAHTSTSWSAVPQCMLLWHSTAQHLSHMGTDCNATGQDNHQSPQTLRHCSQPSTQTKLQPSPLLLQQLCSSSNMCRPHV